MNKPLTWADVSPKKLGMYDPEHHYLRGEIDTGSLGGWLTEDDPELTTDALNYLKAIGSTYGMEALENLLRYGDGGEDYEPVVDPDYPEYASGQNGGGLGLDSMLGTGSVDAILNAINQLSDNSDTAKVVAALDSEPDVTHLLKNITDDNHLPIEGGNEVFEDGGVSITDPRFDATARWWFETPEDAIAYHGDKYADAIKQFYAKHPWETADTEDVNGDGDTDVVTADTNGNGEKDTAVVTADSEPEKKEAVKAAKEDLGLDKKDKTSTGKTKGELEKDKDVVSDEKKKDMTCSDATQKNIMAALLDHRF